MLQTGFTLPLSVIANGQTTGNSWTNPNNILLVDGDTADSNSSPTTPSDITVGNFNFNIPQGSIINGIEYRFVGYRGPQTSPIITLTPYAEDDTSGTPLYYPGPAFTGFTQSLATYTLGSSSYLFVTTWTVDQINNFKFNLVAYGPTYMDAVLVNVWYTPPVTPTPTLASSACPEELQTLPFQIAVELLATDTSMIMKSFNYPSPTNVTPTPISMADTNNTYIDLVVDKGLGNMENVRIDTITPLPNGYVQLFFQGGLAGRGLGFKPPYTSSIADIRFHTSNATVIISNSGPFYQRFLKLCDIDVLVSPPISVLDEGALVTPHVHLMDFQGGGVTVQVPNPSFPDNIRIVIPGNSTTPPQLDSTSTTTSGNVQVTSLTWQHTNDGVDRLLLVQISTEQVASITGVTYNGVPLTLAISDTDVANNIRSEQWYLIAPPIGTHNIVVSLSPAAYISAGAESYVAVDQSSPIGDTNSATGSSVTPSVIITTVANYSLVADGIATAHTPQVFNPGFGQTENWHQSTNTVTRQGASSLEPAGTSPDAVTMDWTLAVTTNWVITAVEIKGINAVVSPISTEDEGILIDANTIQYNFTGTGVTATQTAPGFVEVRVPGAGGQTSIQFENEGSPLGSPGTVDEVDFVGPGVTATRAGNKITVTVAGASGSGGTFQQFLSIQGESLNAASAIGLVGTATTNGASVYIATSLGIFKYDTDPITGMYAFAASGGTTTVSGMTVIGSILYVSYRVGNVAHIDQYNATTLAFIGSMTGVGVTNAITNKIIYNDGTDLYMYVNNSPTWNHYTISGTALTLAGTLTGELDPAYCVFDGTNLLSQSNNTNVISNRNPATGTTNSSYTRNFISVGSPFGIPTGKNPIVAVPTVSGQMYLGFTINNGLGITSSPEMKYLSLNLMPVERP